MSKKSKILIIDDEKNTREGLQRLLASHYDVSLADNARTGLDMVLEQDFDIVLTDLRMPELDGLNFIKRVTAIQNPPVCIMLTAYGSVENAVDAMKAGAYDFLTKPINLDNLEIVIRRALESGRLKKENKHLKRELASQFAFEKIIGKSVVMQEVFDTLKQIAPARSTVLLSGESGTGKELAAGALHQLSDRADKPFIAVHCAALTRSLLESELFGHEKGAFTGATERRIGRFEAADGGTLFLDEIAEIEPSVQVALLRILETRAFERVGGTNPIEVNVRLVAATNRTLEDLVKEGSFREDLYFRLDVLNIHMPPLRDRREDIPLLLNYYLDLFNRENNRKIEGFSPQAIDLLTAYKWPGNVRELRNAVERMIVMTREKIVTANDVPRKIRDESPTPLSPDSNLAIASDSLDIDSHEKFLIMRALDEYDGNRTAAAKKLGISRRTIIRKIEKYEL